MFARCLKKVVLGLEKSSEETKKVIEDVVKALDEIIKKTVDEEVKMIVEILKEGLENRMGRGGLVEDADKE
jgi:hypothetical protein